MTREYMKRSAADNQYLHKDFHGALSVGIEYLHTNYGPNAVREFLRKFANDFYAPLKKLIADQGLAAIKAHYQNIYEIEGGSVEFELTEDELIMKTQGNPAVVHMREKGLMVADMFDETIRSVNEGICDGTDFAAELVEYDPQNGASVQRFYRRNA